MRRFGRDRGWLASRRARHSIESSRRAENKEIRISWSIHADAYKARFRPDVHLTQLLLVPLQPTGKYSTFIFRLFASWLLVIGSPNLILPSYPLLYTIALFLLFPSISLLFDWVAQVESPRSTFRTPFTLQTRRLTQFPLLRYSSTAPTFVSVLSTQLPSGITSSRPPRPPHLHPHRLPYHLHL